MLRRLGRSAIAYGLHKSGADRAIGRLRGFDREPLVLGYHRVFEKSDAAAAHGVPSMDVCSETLEKQLAFVGRRFRFVSLDEMGVLLEAGTAAGTAAVTFDDGYADFYENAFPLLQRMGIPAAVFVVTDLVENKRGFLHDRVYDLLRLSLRTWGPGRLLSFLKAKEIPVASLGTDPFVATRTLLRTFDHDTLSRICDELEGELSGPGFDPESATLRSVTWEDLRHMTRAGVTVGSHTKTHTLLTHATPARVAEETITSRLEIQARLGKPVLHFAYPDGAFNEAAVAAVNAAGYRYAYTGCRHSAPAHPLLTVPRRVLWEGSTRGPWGEFSPSVFSAQINGAFGLGARCSDDHRGRSSSGRSTVAIAAPSLDVLGGQSIQAAAVTRGLEQDGFKVISVPTNPRFPKALTFLRSVPLARTALNQALYGLSLRNLRKADVLHAFSASYWSFLLSPAPAMLMARALGKRVVLNYHSGEAEEHLRNWGFAVHPFLRLADEIVVPSEYLSEVFARHGYETRVVPNVIDTSLFQYRDRIPLKPRFLSTRNLESLYRVDIVLEAFALIRKEHPEATLTIAGSGSDEGRLKRRAEMIGGVTFLGRVTPESMPALYDSADVFLNASEIDNQPLSLLEAMASGLPLVTTCPGAIASFVLDNETGLIVPPSDPMAMAIAALSVLRDEDMAIHLARAARRVAEKYSWAHVRDQWADVYTTRSAPAARQGETPAIVLAPMTALRSVSAETSTLAKERRC